MVGYIQDYTSITKHAPHSWKELGYNHTDHKLWRDMVLTRLNMKLLKQSTKNQKKKSIENNGGKGRKLTHTFLEEKEREIQ